MCRDHVWPDRKWATVVFAVSLKRQRRQRKSRKSLRLHQHLLNISWYLSHDLSADVNIHSTKCPPSPPVRANQHQAAVRASNGGDVCVCVCDGRVPGAGWITWRENLSAYWLILDQKRVQTTGKYTPVLHSHFISHQTSRQTYTVVSRFKLCHFDNFSLTFPVYIIGNVKICIYLFFWILSHERIHNYT